ncbi:hypothetical protein [Pyrococcus kukulkanii]|uniref:Uncharacterized protein n=1 Tax=Pyrococcus kukulkanii TaxID=1609559 RepID=A0A127B814_9EURY|nr:hypothetical protein [Pyrococcus kukulkanii]AMM53510.1 hypothetical protein TQ32_02650 [Pyrococcus kukulkanii]
MGWWVFVIARKEVKDGREIERLERKVKELFGNDCKFIVSTRSADGRQSHVDARLVEATYEAVRFIDVLNDKLDRLYDKLFEEREGGEH